MRNETNKYVNGVFLNSANDKIGNDKDIKYS